MMCTHEHIPVIGIVGRSKSGKTTLIEKLLPELQRRGYRVGTIKHHTHASFEIDQRGKDTWRHVQAGSDHVVIAAPDKMASIRKLSSELSLEEVVATVTGVDLILAEGFLRARIPKIEVVRAAQNQPPICSDEELLAVASDLVPELDVPCLDLDDACGLVDLIERSYFKTSRVHSRLPRNDDPVFSFEDAFRLTLQNITPLPSETVALAQLDSRLVATDIAAQVNSPSVDVSLKDGYAVHSSDIASATPANPVRLVLGGQATAGHSWEATVQPGMAIRVLSGAPIPEGADAVVSGEFARDDGVHVHITNHAHQGRNILFKGDDVAVGNRLVEAGSRLQPTQIGLLAAGGHTHAQVFQQPRVALIATGDEVVAPGFALSEGKVFASNLVTLAAWCQQYGMTATVQVVPDDASAIQDGINSSILTHDVVLTSGGAWTGERDLVIAVLNDLGWQQVFHRVRMGPGKAIGFGLLHGKPVFCLPGGPPSNHMAFLQLALPGLLHLAGHRTPGLPVLTVKLAAELRGQREWTQFVHGQFECQTDRILFHPMQMPSRLHMMAMTEGLVMVPEGIERIPAGALVQAQVLVWPLKT